MTSAAAQARLTFEGVAEKVRSGSRDVLESSDEAITKAKEAGRTFDQQSVRLTQASADASEQVRRLAQEELVLRRDLFLKTARFIIEDLDSTSIDLTRVLHNEVPKTDWKHYVKGDRGVFTRALLRGREASLAARVTEKIKTNQDMRDYVVRYVDQVDRLLNEAQDSDPENLLHSTFMTADAGKLYILLCRALGRKALRRGAIPMGNYQICAAVPEDAEALYRFGENLLAETSNFLRGPGERARSGGKMCSVTERFDALSHYLLLNVWDGHDAVAEEIAMGGDFNRNQYTATVETGVLVAHSRRGLGLKFMHALEAFAQESGLRRLELTVMAYNTAARALYVKLGFVIEGTKRDYMFVDGSFVSETMIAKMFTCLGRLAFVTSRIRLLRWR